MRIAFPEIYIFCQKKWTTKKKIDNIDNQEKINKKLKSSSLLYFRFFVKPVIMYKDAFRYYTFGDRLFKLKSCF